jgi:hypothetical protein
MEARWRPTYSSVGEGRVDGMDAKGARGCITSALHPGAAVPRSTSATKGEREECDDRDVTRCQRGPQLAEAALARGRWLVGWAALGLKGRSGPVGWQPVHVRGKGFPI